MSKSILILLFALISTTAISQRYLVVKKRTKVLAVFEQGDRIKIKLSNEDHYFNFLILGFDRDKIRTRFYDIDINDIDKIYGTSTNQRGLRVFSELTIKGGILFISIQEINQLIQGRGIKPDEKALLISGSMIGTGLLLKLFTKNKFNVNDSRYRLELVDFVP